MARVSKSGSKKTKAKARKTAKAGRRSAPKAKPRKSRLIAELEAQLDLRTKELSEALANQTATAEILRVISRSTFDLQAVLTTLVRSTLDLCNAPIGTFFLRDGDELHLATQIGCSPELVRHFQNNPIPLNQSSGAGRAFSTSTVVHFPDVLAEPDYQLSEVQRLGGYRSLLAVPLLREQQVIGVFSLSRTEPQPFSLRQINLVTTFADQAVIAIENARLFNETKEALERQIATSEVLQLISSSPGELEPLFGTMLTSAMRLCEASHGVVWLREGDGFRSAALHGPWPDGFVEQWRSGTLVRPGADAPITRAAVTGKAVQTADLSESPAYRSGDPLPVAAVDVAGIRTVLSVPMFRDGECVGAIALSRREVRLFTDKQIDLVASFAKQAAIAIENARLLNETHEALERQTATADVLSVISRSAGDLAPVFDAMLGKAMQLCGANFGVLNTFDGTQFRSAATHGLPAGYDEYRKSQPLDYGPATAPARLLSGEPFVEIVDLVDSDAYRNGEPNRRALVDIGGAQSLLTVPLLKDDRVIGNVMIFRQEQRTFSEKQITLLQQFAAQAVIAIENARLLQELRQSTLDLTRSLDDLRTTQDRLVQTEKLASLGQLTAGIAHEIKNPLNFVNNFSSLSAELVDELDETLLTAPLDQKMRGDVSELTQMLKSNLGKVVQHGKRADSIVKNMLLHSREGSGEHRSADINALVEESLNLAYHGARAETPGFNITLKRDLDPNAGEIELYPQEITRALLNLISNGFYAATKRKSEGGDETFEPILSAATRKFGDRVEIRIRDNGTGIPPNVREKMFNPFFTTKPAGEGTGLGLSMSHDIVVKQHGGRIDIETEPGQYTEFTIVLPRKSSNSNEIRGKT